MAGRSNYCGQQVTKHYKSQAAKKIEYCKVVQHEASSYQKKETEMAGRSNYCGQQVTKHYKSQAPKKIEYIKVVQHEASSHQRTGKNNTTHHKETGIYTKQTVKQSVSTGEVFKERSSWRTAYKDEFKTTSTSKIRDKSGYYEYQREERFRRVSYESSSSGSGGRNNGSSKKYLK